MDAVSDYIIPGCWIIFLIYWFIHASRVKAVAQKNSFQSSLLYRLFAVVAGILLWNPRISHSLNRHVTAETEWTSVCGALVCVIGLFVAIWARRTLAGNWSSEVTVKQEHELVKTGPYRFVRHPIYTGILLMCLATAIDLGRLRCWLGVLLFGICFWIKLKQEEKLMLQHFPDQYPAYRKEVKALVPLII